MTAYPVAVNISRFSTNGALKLLGFVDVWADKLIDLQPLKLAIPIAMAKTAKKVWRFMSFLM
jgi:hypothetical protein